MRVSELQPNQETAITDEPSIQLRLSHDGLRLELFLPIDSLPVPTAVMLAQIQHESRRLHLYTPLRAKDLAARLRDCRYGTWIPILERTAPTPPLDEQVELLVPVAVSGQQPDDAYHTVHAHAPIARIRPGRPGIPGYDLRHGVLPARPLRRAHLPQGENTYLSADASQLLAACDGEVVLRHMCLHVRPSHIHDGDLTAAHGPLTSATAVTVLGNVCAGALIDVAGDIHVVGSVEQSRITSRRGSIFVDGSVTGTTTQPSQLQAFADIHCHAALHAEVTAGQDLHLGATAHRCSLHVGRNIHLEQTLDESLREVTLQIGGGVLPRLRPLPALVPMSPDAERQHVRVSVRLPAQLALHGPSPLSFRPYVVEDLSAEGARCRIAEAVPDLLPMVGAIVQLKVALPDGGEQLLSVGRVVRQAGPLSIGVAFLQMRKHDQTRLREFCQTSLRHRSLVPPGTRADRR